MNKYSVSKKTHLIYNSFDSFKSFLFWCEGSLLIFFQVFLFIIILVFSRKRECFICWCCWFEWYLPSSWIWFFIRKIIVAFYSKLTRSSSLIAYIQTRSFSIISSLWCDVLSNSSLASFIIFITSETCECWFCQGEIEEPGNNRIFSYHPMLKTHSNQDQDNAINYLFIP